MLREEFRIIGIESIPNGADTMVQWSDRPFFP